MHNLVRMNFPFGTIKSIDTTTTEQRERLDSDWLEGVRNFLRSACPDVFLLALNQFQHFQTAVLAFSGKLNVWALEKKY